MFCIIFNIHNTKLTINSPRATREGILAPAGPALLIFASTPRASRGGIYNVTFIQQTLMDKLLP